MASKVELPDVTVMDLNEIYLKAVNEVIEMVENKSKVFEKNFLSLASYMTVKDLKTSMNAFYFILKLLNLTKPGVVCYFKIFDLLIRRCGSSSHSGPILDGILTTLTNHFVVAVRNDSSDAAVFFCFTAITERLQQFIIHLNPNFGFHFFNHFRSLDPKVLKTLYGKVLLQILFEEINLPKYQSLDFWNVLKSDETLIFTLMLWIKENDFPKLIHVYSLIPEHGIYKDFSILFLANLFVQLSLHGINKDIIYEKLLVKIFEADELVQSIICTLLALNLRYCPCSVAPKYLILCTNLIDNNAVFKQVAQLLKVQLIFFGRDNAYFHDFNTAMSLLNDAIEKHLQDLENITKPILCDLSLQFIIKRYPALNKSFEILRFLYAFHSNPKCIPPWVERYATLGFMIPKLDKEPENDCYSLQMSEEQPTILQEKMFSENNNDICIALLNYIMFYIPEHLELALNLILKTDKKDLCAAWTRFFIEDNPYLQNTLLGKIGSAKDHKGADDFRMKLFTNVKNNPNNADVGLVENVYLKLKNHANIKMDESIINQDSKELVLAYLLMLNKAVMSNANYGCQEFLCHLNNLMNKWLSKPTSSFVISAIIDCLKTFCERNRLIVLPICGEVVRIAINVNSDCVFRRFLTLVPDKVYLKSFRFEDFALVSKSVYVLWKLVVFNSGAAKQAADALTHFNLEYFDGALLSCCDHNEDPTSENYQPVRGKISECCWLHLLLEIKKEYCITVFTKLIEKGTANTPRHENYSCLHRGLAMYIKEAMDDDFEYFDPENEPLTDICLNLLCTKWERSNIDFSFTYEFFNKCSNFIEYQNKVLLMLILNAETHSAKDAFNKLISRGLIKPQHTKMLYLLEGKQKKDAWFNIFKYTNANVMKKCISTGLIEAYRAGHFVDYAKLMFILRNPQVSFCVKHSIICHLLRIWHKSSKGKYLDLACSVLARCDIDFIRSIPQEKMDLKLNKKYLEILIVRAMNSKLLSDFAECFEFAKKYPSLKCSVLHGLIRLVKIIGTANPCENQIFLSQFVLKVAYRLSNFNAALLAVCFDGITGTMVLSPDLTLNSAIDHIPLSFTTFYKSKEPTVLKMLFNWMEYKKLKPVFREAFRATAMQLCDAIPNVQYSMYVDISKA